MKNIVFFLLLCLQVFAAEPQLKCEKKWGEVHFYGKPIRRYCLRADSFPEGKRFRLIVKWFNGEEIETFAYMANRKGHLILAEKEKNDPLYALCPLKQGERIEFLMRSEDDPSFFAETSIVPFPLEFKTKSGLQFSLELNGQNGDHFRLLAKGFCSGEIFELHTSFQEKQYSYSLIATPEGAVDFPLTLEINEEQDATCAIMIKRAKEKIPFSFPAGKAALEIAGGFALEIR